MDSLGCVISYGIIGGISPIYPIYFISRLVVLLWLDLGMGIFCFLSLDASGEASSREWKVYPWGCLSRLMMKGVCGCDI